MFTAINVVPGHQLYVKIKQSKQLDNGQNAVQTSQSVISCFQPRQIVPIPHPDEVLDRISCAIKCTVNSIFIVSLTTHFQPVTALFESRVKKTKLSTIHTMVN